MPSPLLHSILSLFMALMSTQSVFDSGWLPVKEGISYKVVVNETVYYHLVHIDLSHPNISVKPIVSGRMNLADPHQIVYETLPELAVEHQAFIAINAGFFDPRWEQGDPEETLIVDGNILHFSPNRSTISFTQGTADIGVWERIEDIPYKEHVVGAGPLIIENGKYYFDPYNERFRTKVKIERSNKPNARTVVALSEDHSDLIFLIAERYNKRSGITAEESAFILQSEFEIDEAMMLDGGSSSSLLIDGQLMTHGKPRKVISAVGVFVEK